MTGCCCSGAGGDKVVAGTAAVDPDVAAVARKKMREEAVDGAVLGKIEISVYYLGRRSVIQCRAKKVHNTWA